MLQVSQFPSTEEEWIAIAEEFERRWQFPNCLGAVDEKRVAIVPPVGAGSHFFNYKGYHSIVLMGIANANYEFIYVDIGKNGRISDGGVLQKTKFLQSLQQTHGRNPTQNAKIIREKYETYFNTSGAVSWQ